MYFLTAILDCVKKQIRESDPGFTGGRERIDDKLVDQSKRFFTVNKPENPAPASRGMVTPIMIYVSRTG
jgi:hypothetical protein